MMFCLLKLLTVVSILLPRRESPASVVLSVLQMVMDVPASVALGDLLVFHAFLKYKGRSTYEHILLLRQQKQEKEAKNGQEGEKTGEEKSIPATASETAHKQTNSETEICFINLKTTNKPCSLASKQNLKDQVSGLELSKKTSPANKNRAKDDLKNKDQTDTQDDSPEQRYQEESYDYNETVFTRQGQEKATLTESSPSFAAPMRKFQLTDSGISAHCLLPAKQSKAESTWSEKTSQSPSKHL
jgi:hypothetical protein